jgi:hypothetical protein
MSVKDYLLEAKLKYQKRKLSQKMPPYPTQTMEEMHEMLHKLRPTSKKARQILKQLAIYEQDDKP